MKENADIEKLKFGKRPGRFLDFQPMNRLKKKCFIATVGIHLLLLTILVVGPAFYNPQPKSDSSTVLTVIPDTLVDAALNSGVRNATPPAPAPIVTPPQPQQTPPTPAVQPVPPPPAPKPVTEPSPSWLKRIFEPAPKPAPNPTESKPEHKIQVNTDLVTRTAPKNNPNQSTPNNSRRDVRALNSTIKNLRSNLSSPTEVNLPGDSTVAYANYGSVVTSVYHQKWITLEPTGMEKENAVVTFKVTIASDGSVISASIVTPSGDANVDRGVQRMLDDVTFIAPFPEGATEKERTYTIDFNAIRATE